VEKVLALQKLRGTQKTSGRGRIMTVSGGEESTTPMQGSDMQPPLFI
jgi:hypothetical protein